MIPDQSDLYNKFHAISIGLRTINRCIDSNEIKKAKEIIEILMKESDKGMGYIGNIERGEDTYDRTR